MTLKATRGFILAKLHERQQRCLIEMAEMEWRTRQHFIDQEHIWLREEETRRNRAGNRAEIRRMERDRDVLNIHDDYGYLVQRIDVS